MDKIKKTLVYGKIYTYENRNEAEIGKRYVFSNNWMFVHNIVILPLSSDSKLIAVKNNDGYPFVDEDGANFQFIREVIEESVHKENTSDILTDKSGS